LSGLPWLVLLQAGCLINTRLYEERLAELSEDEAPDDTPTDTLPETAETGHTGLVDEDGDGFYPPQDCNDSNPAVHPGACDACKDGLDQNCDGEPNSWCHAPMDPVLYDLYLHGYHVDGIAAYDNAGLAIASAGDFDGDGDPDVLVGAPHADPDGVPRAGSAYVLKTPFPPTTVDVGGFSFHGESPDDRAGVAVGSMDINNDGYVDALIGAEGYDGDLGDMGAVYLVYGDPNLVEGDYALAQQGVLWVGEAGSRTGNAVVGVRGMDPILGDVVAVAAEEAGQQKGAVILVPGDTQYSGTHSLGVIGVEIVGEAAGDRFGSSLADASDIDGDGLGDLVIGAQGSAVRGEGSGAAYLWFGAPLFMLQGPEAGQADWVIEGESAGDRAGSAVSAGDLDEDGYSDAVIGARNHVGGPSVAGGAVYVLTQSQLGQEGDRVGLENADAKLFGEHLGDRVGQSVSVVGDLNCDGVGDLVIGGDGYDAGRGAAYIVLGPVQGDRLLETDESVIRMYGRLGSSDALGASIAAMGDLDHDGCRDFGLSAYRYEVPTAVPATPNQGRVWFVFGSP
jgi:hypothetical protein